MRIRSGLEESVPYSLSRWTDVPDAKWGWFLASLDAGRMQAFDPRTGTPDWWSLSPEDTHSLVFWTKTPKNLVRNFDRLAPYKIKAHVTITGWTEVEHAAPSIEEATEWACRLSDKIGKDNLTWRFSPVPLLDNDSKPSLFSRFESIASKIHRHTTTVFLSFLQLNDLIPETRDDGDRSLVMDELGYIAKQFKLQVRLCNADASEYPWAAGPGNLSRGVCVPCESVDGGPVPVSEKCGCAIMVDPFTINETCTMGCEYCYAADKTLSAKKRNTTRGLPVLK